MNTLVVIGWTGCKKCYLNISREEAIERYKEEDDFAEYLDIGDIEVFNFDDEFGAYDVWEK